MSTVPGGKCSILKGYLAGGLQASDVQTLWFVGVGMTACVEGNLKYPGM